MVNGHSVGSTPAVRKGVEFGVGSPRRTYSAAQTRAEPRRLVVVTAAVPRAAPPRRSAPSLLPFVATVASGVDYVALRRHSNAPNCPRLGADAVRARRRATVAARTAVILGRRLVRR